jgi:hypothetical protein
MKMIKIIMAFLAVAAVLGLVSLAAAATPVYDNVWFQLKIQAKGYAVDLPTGNYARTNLSLPAYIQLQWDAAHSRYNVVIWCKTDNTTQNLGWEKMPGVSYAQPEPPGTGTENFLICMGAIFRGTNGTSLSVTYMAFITHKTDAHGALHATWKGTGMVYQGAYVVSGKAEEYLGYVNISGKNVDPATLPFTP